MNEDKTMHRYPFLTPPPHETEINTHLDLLSTITVPGIVPRTRPFLMLSTPKTTGKDFLDRLMAGDDPETARMHARQVNTERAEVLTEDIRRSRLCVFTGENPLLSAINFNPTGWTNMDFHHFWGEVVHRYVYKIFFQKNWHYSEGCTFEFCAGVENRIELFDHLGHRLSALEGVQLIEQGIAFCEEAGWDASLQRGALAFIHESLANAPKGL